MQIRQLPLVLATTALAIGAALAIGGSSERLARSSADAHPLATQNYVDGLARHRFRITAHTLSQWQAGPTPPLVVDLRAAAPYDAAHIPGAVQREAGQLLLGKASVDAGARPVVIYDQDGRLGPYLVHPLRRAGVNAYLLAGGYAGWHRAQSSYARKPAATEGGRGAGVPAAAPTPPAPDAPGVTAVEVPGAPAPAAAVAPVAEEGC